jgi:hypothetical protein
MPAQVTHIVPGDLSQCLVSGRELFTVECFFYVDIVLNSYYSREVGILAADNVGSASLKVVFVSLLELSRFYR